MAFLQPYFSTVCYVSVLMVLHPQGYNLHSHLYMAQCKKCPSDLLALDTHILALIINNVWLCQFILNSKLSSILDPSICEDRSSNKLNTYFIFIYIQFAHDSMFVWRMLTMVRESCHSCWYSENSSFLHSWAWTCDESCLSSGVAIWSFLCSFLYTLNARMSNTWYDIFVVKSQQRVSHYIAPFD